jgi:hypothetical protein
VGLGRKGIKPANAGDIKAQAPLSPRFYVARIRRLRQQKMKKAFGKAEAFPHKGAAEPQKHFKGRHYLLDQIACERKL